MMHHKVKSFLLPDIKLLYHIWKVHGVFMMKDFLILTDMIIIDKYFLTNIWERIEQNTNEYFNFWTL